MFSIALDTQGHLMSFRVAPPDPLPAAAEVSIESVLREGPLDQSKLKLAEPVKNPGTLSDQRTYVPVRTPLAGSGEPRNDSVIAREIYEAIGYSFFASFLTNAACSFVRSPLRNTASSFFAFSS